jgi:N-formylglutamate amidohydrolase
VSFMTDTHIHIHLNGEAVESASSPPSKRRVAKAKSPPKKKRAVSPYHKTVGKEMKKLKKAGFRGNVMKRAHSIAKKKHKKKR